MSDIRSRPPVGMVPLPTKAALAAGSEALGSALGVKFFAEVKAQAVSLKRYLLDLIPLDQKGREAFRVELSTHLKEARKAVKETEGTPAHAGWKSTLRSAGVRISEAIAFSKAIDAGFVPDQSMGYHVLVASARVFNDAKASTGATGPTVRRGRKAMPWLERFRKHLERNIPTDPADIKAAIADLRSMLK